MKHFFSKEWIFLLGLACLNVLLHFLTNHNYGYFRDEFYYIACGEHLDWGYVDHPPLIAVIANVSRALLGDSLFGLRFFSAVAGGGVVLVTGLMVRKMGGTFFAQVLSALCAFVAPVLLGSAAILSMNPFDQLFWALAMYVLVCILQGGNPKLWLLFGLIVGIAALNKYSIFFLLGGLGVGFLLTRARRYFFEKWLYAGVALAFLIFLPHLIWQIQHGWPTLEFMEYARKYKNTPHSTLEFLLGQILNLQPFTFPIWITGLLFCLLAPAGKLYRVFAWMYLTVFALFVYQNGKTYYLAPAYPILFAAGAFAIANFIERRRWKWAKIVILFLLVINGAMSAPMALPILPVETFIQYSKMMGVEPPQTEVNKVGKLPQFYADMFGWKNMVNTVANVYKTLSPEDQLKCAIYVQNYGEAGAIDFFGPKLKSNLPKAICGHNSYYLWGPRTYTGELVLIVGGGEREDHEEAFEQVDSVAAVTSEYAMPFENNLPIFICRKIKFNLHDRWESVKHYD